jgi:hypothetical protein
MAGVNASGTRFHIHPSSFKLISRMKAGLYLKQTGQTSTVEPNKGLAHRLQDRYNSQLRMTGMQVTDMTGAIERSWHHHSTYDS